MSTKFIYKRRPLLNIALAVTLAFSWPILAVTSAFATPTPQQSLAALQADLAAYTAQFNQYNMHYQTYAPTRISELSTASTALTDFTAKVSALQNAVTTLNQDSADLATAQANLANQPGVIASTETSYQDALAAYTAATAAYNAIHPTYTSAQVERDTAYSAYIQTAQGGTITETFNNAQLQTSAQFLVDGTSALSTSNNSGYSLTNNEFSGTYMSGGVVKAYYPSATLTIIPPNQTATTFFQFATGALNGDFNAIITYTDGSTGTLLVPNGVYYENQGNTYTLTQSITAPAGKYIQSITIPAFGDWYYMDNFVFTSQTYDAALYQTYLTKQSALDTVLTTYTPALAAYNSAYQTLVAAESTYNTARSESTTATLQSLVDTEQTNYDASLLATQTAITDALTAKEATVTALDAIVLPPDSLEVTSTADTLDPGTLRWAITQANATAGTIYDRIKITTSGTITLTSNLPTITDSLTILGPTADVIRINGADTYAAFYMASTGKTVNISDLTIEHTKRTDWQQGSGVFIARGTANITRVTFQDITTGSAVTTKEGSSYINISASNFKRITQYGVFSNYGSTPSTTTEADTQYDNRITITTSNFENNGAGIYGERTVLVDSSTFKNNQYGFRMQGINKHRVTNSTFEGNQVDIYTSSWIPTSWTTFFAYPSRVITGNTFKSTTNTPIIIDDHMNDGKSTALTALITGNSWDEASTNFVRYGQYDTTLTSNQTYYLGLATPTVTPPFTYTAPTSIKPVITAPTNVQAVVNQDGSVTVSWTPSTATNTTIDYYVISWSTTNFVSDGWGWTHTEPTVTIPAETFATTSGLGVPVQFSIRADNNAKHIYVSSTNTAEVTVPAPAPTQEPVTPTPTPAPVDPTPTPEPEPSPTSEPEPTTEPSPEPEPTVEPTQEPTPEPSPSEEPTKTEETITSVEDLPEEITAEVLMEIALDEIVPTDLTPDQAEAIKEAALEVFETAVAGSPEYEKALDALYVAAAADDIVLSPELAAIPGAQELVAVLNLLSNVGADISPTVRAEAQKATVAAVIVGQIAGAAMTTSAAASSSTSSTRRNK